MAESPTQVYYFSALSFGLCTAPSLFTRIIEQVAGHLRTQGMFVHVYIDDWLIRDQDHQRLSDNVPKILDFLQGLGWQVNLKKSRIVPSQVFEYLGVRFDTKQCTVRPSDRRIVKLDRTVERGFPDPVITPRQLASVEGLLNSVSEYLPLGRLHLRPIQFWLHLHWKMTNPKVWDIPIQLRTNSDLF